MSQPVPASGALRFARYAFPPNHLGYCGPPQDRELLERVASAAVDPGLAQLARGFEGAWPYLELIAGSCGRQPLDAEVVDAYWIGSDTLDRVPMSDLGNSIDLRFRHRVATNRESLSHGVLSGGVPHHSFHVFCVYPWVGLLRSGAPGHALTVLQNCRIRTGRVLEVTGSTATVLSRPLTWDGQRLGFGAPEADVATLTSDGYGLVDVEPGDLAALHWDWVCDQLTPEEAQISETITARHVAIANANLAIVAADSLGEPTVESR